MTYIPEVYQKAIAKRALDLFKYCWRSPYTFKSDSEWACELRSIRDRPDADLFGLLCAFLWDYGLWKNIKWCNPDCSQGNRPDSVFIRTLQDEVSSNRPDPYRLTNNWIEKKALKTRQFSAAAKLLFFMRPDAKLAIYDSRTCEAVKCRLNSQGKNPGVKRISGGFKDSSEDFAAFMAHVSVVATQNENTWFQSLEAIVGKDSGNTTDFLLRRVADKHLFLEGKIINEHKKTKDWDQSVCKVLEEGNKQLGAEVVSESDVET